MRGVLPLPRAAGLCARSAVRPARPPAPRSHALIARRAAPAGLGGPLPPVAPVVPPPASESLADGADKQHAPPAPRASVIRAAAAGDEPRPLDPLPAAATGAADATAAAAPAAAAGAKPPDAAPAAALPSAAESAQAADDAIEAAARLLLAPYHAYARALEERPLLTKACTSFVGFMIGDLLAQSVAHAPAAALAPPPPVDAARVLRLGLYGLCVDGPLGAAWYDWLEANVSPDSPRSTRAVLLKTALDQIVYASFGTVLFFTVVTLLEGRPGAVPAVVAAKFWPTLVANYAIWPLAHLINFKFVPAPYRIAYNNVVAIGWLALLSAITHSPGSSVLTKLVASLQALLPHAH